MNMVDVILILILIAALMHGALLGMWQALAQYAGVFWGLIIGALLAPQVIGWLDVSDSGMKALTAAGVVAATTATGSIVGYLAGLPVRDWISERLLLGQLDHAFGAVFSVFAAAVCAWLIALGLSQGPNPQLASSIQQSSIIRTFNSISPGAPGFVLRLERTLSDQLGGTIFDGLEPTLPSALPPNLTNAQSATAKDAAARTYKIAGQGCGGVITGSAFPVAPDIVLTNAHVVAGTVTTRVITPDGRELEGNVVLFDPESDLAAVQVDGLNAKPFVLKDADRGTQGIVIGYPEGGPETVVSAVVNGSIIANGRDIFGANSVSRHILVISADVKPGNSGGPLLDMDGNVIGLVYAESLSSGGQGFALSLEEIKPDLEGLEKGHPTFDKARRFTCAR
ncbi:MarP family serine protease [bacterium]|nr:MarP family serine protease [bacterium]